MKKAVIYLILVLSFLLSISVIYAENGNLTPTLVLDYNFDDGNWTDIFKKKEGKWEIIDGQLCLTKLSGSIYQVDNLKKEDLKNLNYVYIPNVGKDLMVRAKVTPLEIGDNRWSGMGIFVHGSPEGVEQYHKWALCFRFKKEKGKYKVSLLEEWTGVGWPGDTGQFNAEYAFNISTGVSYFMKMEVIGKVAWGKVWKADEPEPEKWLVVAVFSDNNVDDTAVGLFSHDFKVKFDDIRIEALPKGYTHKGKKLDRNISDYASSIGFSANNLTVGNFSTYISEYTLNENLVGVAYDQKSVSRKNVSFKIISAATPSIFNSIYDSKFKPKYVTASRIVKSLKGGSVIGLSGVYISFPDSTDTVKNNFVIESDYNFRITQNLNFFGEMAFNRTNCQNNNNLIEPDISAYKSGIKYRFRQAVFEINQSRINPGYTLLLGTIIPDIEQWNYSWTQNYKNITQNISCNLTRNNLENQITTTTRTKRILFEWYWNIIDKFGLNFALEQSGLRKDDCSIDSLTNSYFIRPYWNFRTINFALSYKYDIQNTNIVQNHYFHGLGTDLQYNFQLFGFPSYCMVDYKHTDDYTITGEKVSSYQSLKFGLKMSFYKSLSIDYAYRLNIFDSFIPGIVSSEKGEFCLKVNYFVPLRKGLDLAGNFEIN